MQTDPTNKPIFDPPTQPESNPPASMGTDPQEADPRPPFGYDPANPQKLSLNERKELEAKERRDAFVKQLLNRNNQPAPAAYVPPPPPQRILDQTALEMECGRAQVEKNEAQQDVVRAARARQMARDAHLEGKITPVFRPSDYVPDMAHGTNTQASIVKAG